MRQTEQTESGVDTLITRLRADGVTAGTAEAARLVDAAKAEASQIVAQARSEATTITGEAQRTAVQYEQAGKDALDTAMRDAVLSMKSTVMAQFENDVKRITSQAVADPGMLKQMVLELVGRAAQAIGNAPEVEVILPAQVVRAEAIRDNAEDIQSGRLTEFVLGLSQSMLEEGVTLHVSDDLQGGIRARVTHQDILLDLSDEAIAALLLQHLQPQFRAVLEGAVR